MDDVKFETVIINDFKKESEINEVEIHKFDPDIGIFIETKDEYLLTLTFSELEKIYNAANDMK